MRLKQYLIVEGRGKQISLDEALNIAPKYMTSIKRYIKNNEHIARDITIITDYYLVDPKKVKEPRKSRYTENYYTLIMDNSKKWSKYPKRSLSLTCSMEKGELSRDYYVFPKNDANIGVCSNKDLWWSFKKGLSPLNDLTMLTYTIKDLLDETYFNSQDDDYNIFKQQCKFFDNYIKEKDKSINNILSNPGSFNYSRIVSFFDNNYKGDLYQMIEDVLDPIKNGFNRTTPNGKWYNEREVWTDSESLMIMGKVNLEIFLKELGRI
uniref:Uncharacterized protein n=3 Tax=viral metagenome TaxID=1070528 RepID=A0A6M3IS36_9ZZZZ